MSCTTDNNSKPKSMSRAKGWTAEVENLFRFQQAGYRDELEYIQVKQGASVNISPCLNGSCVMHGNGRQATFSEEQQERKNVHSISLFSHYI
uniref:Uncharacterized protein n=1 Tax=Anabas testudineus TaxID=64144 RepID=A0A7N5ZVW7_ANATE